MNYGVCIARRQKLGSCAITLVVCIHMYIVYVLIQVQSHPLSPVEIENLLQNPATLRSEYKVR